MHKFSGKFIQNEKYRTKPIKWTLQNNFSTVTINNTDITRHIKGKY